jgi:hypothetical protein
LKTVYSGKNKAVLAPLLSLNKANEPLLHPSQALAWRGYDGESSVMCHFTCFTFSCKKRRRTEDINISTRLWELYIFLMFYMLVYSSSWARVRINSGNTLITMLLIFCSVDLTSREVSSVVLSLHAMRGLIDDCYVLALIDILPSLTERGEGAGKGQWGMIYCIEQWRLRRASIPSAKAGTAQLRASGNSSCWYTLQYVYSKHRLTAEQSLLQQPQHDAFPSFQIMPPLPIPSPPGRLTQKSADSIFETLKNGHLLRLQNPFQQRE